MRAVRLKETRVPGTYLGNDGWVYERVEGVEQRCDRCGCWTQGVYRRGTKSICPAHVEVASRARIRVTTTFACRVYQEGANQPPPGKVLRRGHVLAVRGRPERVGGYDKFFVSECGFVLVPRSRWAWA